MAQLPRYEEVGVRVGQPTLASTAAAEARSKAAGTLADGLNRLSNFAFDEANKQAKVEGLEFGVANAPTPDQMKAAMDAGQPVPMVGDTYSTFGRSAREGALYAMQTNVEIEARNKIADLHAEARQKEMEPAAYQKAMQDIIDGYGSAMGQVSPQTAYAVRAKLSSIASTQFVAHSDWYLQKQQARQKIVVQGGIDGLIKGVDVAIAAGDTVKEGPDGTVVTTVEQKIDQGRAQIARYAAAVNDPALMQTKLKEYDDAVKAAQTSFIATWSQDTGGVPSLAKYQQIMSGKFDAPVTGDTAADAKSNRVARMWSGLSAEHRTKIQDEVRRQMSATLELDSKLDATVERQRKEAQATNRIDFMKAWEKGDSAAQTSALQRMQGLHDAEGFEKYSKLVGENGANTEPGLMFKLEGDLARGSLTTERVGALVAERKLSTNDARTLLPKITSANDGAMAESLTFVKNALGYPDKPLINPSMAQRKAEQQVHEIHNLMISAKRQADMAGKPFDPFAFAQAQIKERQASGPTAQELNAADGQIMGLRKALNLSPEAPLDQVNQALAKAISDKKFNAATATPYQNAIKLLQEHGPK
jgi:hypothetical protein